MTRCKMLLIVIWLTKANLKIRTYPDFCLRVTGFLMGGYMYFQVGGPACNTCHGEADRRCQITRVRSQPDWRLSSSGKDKAVVFDYHDAEWWY